MDSNTSISRVSSAHEIVIYPNPTEDAFRLTTPGKLITRIVMRTSDGRMVYSTPVHSTESLTVRPNLPAGAYVITA